MIILRSKKYSGYSEANPGGNEYFNAQVVNSTILDPLDKGLKIIDDSGIKLPEKTEQKLDNMKSLSREIRKYLDEENEKEYSDTDSGRLPVSDADLEKAKTSGVIQRRPDNGMWGIIAIQKKLWWRSSYSSRESALKSLRAYEMHKHSGH